MRRPYNRSTLFIFGAIAASALFVAHSASAATCTGPFSLQNQQPVNCLPYPNSLWNKTLPTDKMSHLMTNSDVIVNNMFTQDGIYSYPWSRRQGIGGIAPSSSAGNDGNAPLYYGKSSDPVYIVTSVAAPASGAYNPVGETFHAPNGASYNFAHSDGYLNVWDQVSNLLFSTYRFSPTEWTKLPICPGNGHAGTEADPCPASFNYAGISNWMTDPGYGNVASDTLPNGGWATHIRAQEIMNGPIPHALFLVSNCQSGGVFPGIESQGIWACPSWAQHAPIGALFFLDGGYFGEGIGSLGNGPSEESSVMPVPYRIEGAAAYEYSGISYPLYNWFFSFPHDSSNGDPSQSLSCYTAGSFQGCEFNPYINVPLYTGPNCTSSACDISKHMHIADECVAKGLAGVSGGCGTVSPPPPHPSTCTNLWDSSSAIPSGFGASYNLFSSLKEMLLQVYCGSGGATVSVGNGSNWEYIYKTGYTWNGSSWSPFNYSGSLSSDGNWILGSASHDLAGFDLTQKQSVLAYICQWDGSSWHCGCRDASCTTNYWNLQQFKQ
jgi:hypothetical protein